MTTARLSDSERHGSPQPLSEPRFEVIPLPGIADEFDHHLPVRVGIAGPVGMTRLLRIGARVGVGDSLRVLRTHRGMMQHISGSWTPGPLLEDLAPAFADPRNNLIGLHIYTFNALAQTAQWWYEEGRPRPGQAVEGEPDDHPSEE